MEIHNKYPYLLSIKNKYGIDHKPFYELVIEVINSLLPQQPAREPFAIHARPSFDLEKMTTTESSVIRFEPDILKCLTYIMYPIQDKYTQVVITERRNVLLNKTQHIKDVNNSSSTSRPHITLLNITFNRAHKDYSTIKQLLPNIIQNASKELIGLEFDHKQNEYKILHIYYGKTYFVIDKNLQLLNNFKNKIFGEINNIINFKLLGTFVVENNKNYIFGNSGTSLTKTNQDVLFTIPAYHIGGNYKAHISIIKLIKKKKSEDWQPEMSLVKHNQLLWDEYQKIKDDDNKVLKLFSKVTETPINGGTLDKFIQNYSPYSVKRRKKLLPWKNITITEGNKIILSDRFCEINKNITISQKYLIGVRWKSSMTGNLGDYSWMIKQKVGFGNLLIYNKNEGKFQDKLDISPGGNNGVARKNRIDNPENLKKFKTGEIDFASLGISTGRRGDGYKVLDSDAKRTIDAGFTQIYKFIQNPPRPIDNIYFSSDAANNIAYGIFSPSDDVKRYINQSFDQLKDFLTTMGYNR